MASSGSNKLFPSQHGFPTPNSPPETAGCRLFKIPAQEDWYALFMDALQPLTFPYNYWTNGDMTPDEIAAAMLDIIDASVELAEAGQCETDVGTPFWDDETDVDDEESVETQPWYGECTNPTAPAAELDFVENALVWFFTGLVALATPELGFAPAILFHTIAPKFLLAQKRGDFGEIIRIVLDGKDMAEIDTSDMSPGDLIETDCIGDPDLSDHTLMIISRLP